MASVILIAPLWVAYQIGILTTDGWRNGVDFITPHLYTLSGGRRGVYFGINGAVLLALFSCAFLMGARRRPTLSTWVWVVLESSLYALVMWLALGKVLYALGFEPPALSLSAADNLVMSFGAGVYEELVFRLGLLAGLLWLGRRKGLSAFPRYAMALVFSGAIFSAFHYSPLGLESWELWSFTYRLFAGMLFGVLFIGRGLAVAVYTHAIYDVFVLVL